MNVENSSHYEDCDFDKAKDLRIDKRGAAGCVGGRTDDSDCGAKIKQESNLQSLPPNAQHAAVRRLFKIRIIFKI